MAPIKIIFLCSNRFALPTLQELVFFKMIAAVIVPRHCDEMLDTVKNGLIGSNIPILEVNNNNYVETIKDAFVTHQAQIGLMVTFSFKIPAEIFTLPILGFYNVHPGPLPSYRGSDPIFQQIKNREKQAGVTIHLVDNGFDSGAVVNLEMIRLLPTDTYGILTTKLAAVAAKQVNVLLKLIGFDLVPPNKQQDENKARYFKKQLAKDTSIDWQTMDAPTIIALVQACNPWNKGSITKVNNRIVRILEANIVSQPLPIHQIKPGTLITTNENGIIVSTINNGFLMVKTIYLEEGFMAAYRLTELGIAVGNQFDAI